MAKDELAGDTTVSTELEEEIDALYAGRLEHFVSGRNALSRKLKQAGAADTAAEVAALRKPTVAAWAVNQLARTHRRDVDLLLDAGKRIVDAQQTSISQGGRAGLDAARGSLRTAVTDLTASAQQVLGDRAGQTTLTRVAETLRSAATEEKGRELLARGRLTAELSDTGWDTIAALAPAPAPRERDTQRDTKGATKRGQTSARLKAAQDAVRKEQSAQSAATTQLRKALRDEEHLRERLQAAETAAEETRAEVAAVEQRLRAAEKKLRELENR
jgi:hypothetical protein